MTHLVRIDHFHRKRDDKPLCQARCSCGWKGNPASFAGTAERHKQKHLDQHSQPAEEAHMANVITHEDLEKIADSHLTKVAKATAADEMRLAELLDEHIENTHTLDMATQDKLIERLAHILNGVKAPVTLLEDAEHERDLLLAERNWLLRGMNVNEQAAFQLLAQTAERAKADKMPKPAGMDVMVERANTAIELGVAMRLAAENRAKAANEVHECPHGCGRTAEDGPCAPCEAEAVAREAQQ